MLALIAAGFGVFRLLSKPAAPPPAEVVNDPLLSQGRLIYLARCVACHGLEGKGDGPIASQLIGPPVGNLTDDVWKHGDRPDQVVSVISQGVPNTRMEGWRGFSTLRRSRRSRLTCTFWPSARYLKSCADSWRGMFEGHRHTGRLDVSR